MNYNFFLKNVRGIHFCITTNKTNYKTLAIEFEILK